MNAVSSSNPGGKTLRRTVVRIQAHLTTLDASHRRNRLLHALSDRVYWGLLLACALLAVGHYVRALHHPLVIVPAVLLSGATVLAQAWGRRRPLADVALWVDVCAGLEERVSSALAFLDDPEPTPMMRETVIDAEGRLSNVDEEHVTGPPASRRWWVVPVLLLLLVPLALWPPRLTPVEQAAKRTQRVIRAAGAQLAADALEAHLSPDAAPAAAAAVHQMREAGEALESGEAETREEAMERLQQAREAADGALREDAARELLGERLQRNAATRAAGEALSNGNTQRAAEALRQAADNLSDANVRGAQGRQLAQDLRSAARSQPSGKAQAAANRAAAGAESGRTDAVREGMRDLAEQVEGMTALGEDRAAVEQAARALQEARDTVGAAEAEDSQPAQGQDSAGQSSAQGPPDSGAPSPGEQTDSMPGSSGGAESPAREAPRQAGGGDGAGAGGASTGEAPALAAAVRVDLVGQLLEGVRADSDRRGGPRVEDDGAPELSRAVRRFRDIGEAEIARQEIPPGRRALVRDYFSALEDVAESRSPNADQTK